MKIRIIFLTLISSLTLNSCFKSKVFVYKETNKIPTGLNHFYFYKVKEGQTTLMVARNSTSDLGTFPAIIVKDSVGEYQQGTLIYTGYRGDFIFGGNIELFFDFEIFINGGITHTGTYPITVTDAPQNGPLEYTQLYQNQSDIYLRVPKKTFYSKPNSGSLTITYLSPDKKEFKGNFNMMLYNSQTGDSVQIKDGHFWINKDSL